MFKGGIRLTDFKELSKGKRIEDFPPPEKAVIPLSQHTGIPAKPVVKRGDAVLKGQVIGEPGGFISSYIHSSVSGKVSGLENRQVQGGKSAMSVIIDNDGQDSAIETKTRDWKSIEPRDIVCMVERAGIAGLGGATFPTFVKLTVPEGKKAECVILNGCECEPFLTADYRVLKESPAKVIEGLLISCRALGVGKAYIGIESNKKDIAANLEEIIGDKGTSGVNMEVRILPEKYPQGGEKQLIKSITGMEVPSGKLPIDTGCIVFNVQTATAIRDAVCSETPLLERVLTVTGLVGETRNLRVRIGTPVSAILQHCGFEMKPGSRIIIGGPMMGLHAPCAEIPVIKGTSGILILPDEIFKKDMQPCIRCGRCIEACPMQLVPAELSRYAESRNWEKCARFDVADCIECGCCSYVCPAKRPMVELFKWAKAESKKMQALSS